MRAGIFDGEFCAYFPVVDIGLTIGLRFSVPPGVFVSNRDGGAARITLPAREAGIGADFMVLVLGDRKSVV